MICITLACTGSAGAGFSFCWAEHGGTHNERQDEIRVAGREVCNPQRKRCLAHLHALEQHPVERQEERHLDQDGQTAGGRVYLLAFVEVHHRLAERLPIVLVALLQRFHARLDFAHFRHRATAGLGQLVERRLDKNGHQDYRQAPVCDEGKAPDSAARTGAPR